MKCIFPLFFPLPLALSYPLIETTTFHPALSSSLFFLDLTTHHLFILSSSSCPDLLHSSLLTPVQFVIFVPLFHISFPLLLIRLLHPRSPFIFLSFLFFPPLYLSPFFLGFIVFVICLFSLLLTPSPLFFH